MGYKINFGAVSIEVETETELRSVLNVLGVRVAQLPLPLDARPPVANVGLNDRLRALCNSLPPNQRRLLECLVSADWVQDTELRAILGIRNNSALAGLWTGVIRNGKRNDVTSAQILRKEHRNGSGQDAGYWYRLTDECRAAMSQR